VSYKLTIPRVPLSPNKLLGKHWSAKAKERTLWMNEIIYGKVEGIPQLSHRWAKEKVKVIITIHNARQYDRDNAWGACKPILDAMKALGLIVDDRAAWCELEVRQEKSTRKDKRTEIYVEPA
jgi:hypothetical protein